MIVDLEGTHLPGRTCGPNPAGGFYANIHVGVGLQREPVDLVPGDAEYARWRLEVRTVELDTGEVDFRGPFVHGSRGDRFLYLNWGEVQPGGDFHLFRRAKISLSEIPPTLVRRALTSGNPLRCTLPLTDKKGWPMCARVRPPTLVWSVPDQGDASSGCQAPVIRRAPRS